MYTNNLINERSPYLLQHAHNPVNWYPWKDELLQKAQKENCLLLISIGYSACHWCHVMEKECFEDEKVAIVMNQHFINLKIDREERPDIDQVYMNALQLMTGRGGWPLNIVALPDGRPVWGATYLPKREWKSTLLQLAALYDKAPEKMIEYAEKLQSGIQLSGNVPLVETPTRIFNIPDIEKSVKKWTEKFDMTYGGMQGAPKFMMPNTLDFLLQYGTKQRDPQVLNFVEFSLTNMAYGGIYDHIGGGFSRYSVDERWHIPHFEKMLYDNAQLASLYSQAYLVFKKPLFKQVTKETLAFIEREMTSVEGSFYAAFDADSLSNSGKKEEGAFYTWKKDELKTLLKNDFQVFADFFNVNEYGYWEAGNYVLIRKGNILKVCSTHNLTPETLLKKIEKCKTILFSERKKRNKPSLDHKILTSWNALTLKAYCDAYRAFSDEHYLNIALKNAHYLLKYHYKNGQLYRNRHDDNNPIPAFLDDYSLLIEALISLYENTFDETWIIKANELTEKAFDLFFDKQNSMFRFTSYKGEKLIATIFETQDNVIPSSNAIMGKILFKLFLYFEEPHYRDISLQMLANMKEEISRFPSGYSNWLMLAMFSSSTNYQLALVGPKAKEYLSEINQHYFPDVIFAGTENAKSKLPLLKNRYISGKTLYYVCEKGSCAAPTENIRTVFKQLKKEV